MFIGQLLDTCRPIFTKYLIWLALPRGLHRVSVVHALREGGTVNRSMTFQGFSGRVSHYVERGVSRPLRATNSTMLSPVTVQCGAGTAAPAKVTVPVDHAAATQCVAKLTALFG
jgi:hypothetical protein